MVLVTINRAEAVEELRKQPIVQQSYEQDKAVNTLAEAMIIAIMALENQSSSFIDGYMMGCGLLGRHKK